MRCGAVAGVTFVFVGDFRQTLSVITKETRFDAVIPCLKSYPLWNSIDTLNLRTNMRAHLRERSDNDFLKHLLELGEGKT